ncbi:hypothetical protein NLG97_g2387 [Lecanicillium saksenae]|uniref:Uncharacterized protein n=1 Tax=Lecanicillium saksenae TaxID=468837 RepID=A0ACC1R1Q8_9HYPO|nr:hypothetical protein NLG97_g2387 [Lecanicillium saksenae]
MALAQAANIAEKALGHDKNAITKQDMSTFPSGGESDLMKALVWMGKNDVQIGNGRAQAQAGGRSRCYSQSNRKYTELVGRQVHNVEVGKRYVASFQIACGDCYFCERKLSSQCEKTNASNTEKSMYGGRTAGIFGYSHLTGGFAGGQAEYVRVPMGDVNLLEIPEDIPDEKALFLSDVLATSYHCVVDTCVRQDDRVAIFGAGPIGQMAGRFALIQGAEKIIFVDTEPRITVIKSHFKSEEVDVVDYKKLSNSSLSSNTVVSQLKKLCDGRGPDVALECAAGEYPKSWLHWLEMNTGAETDTSEIVNECIESVRSFGRCGVTGVYAGFTNHFNIGSLMQRGIRLIGNGQAPVHKYWKGLLEDIQGGRINPLEMVSHRVRLEDLDKVYHAFDAKRDGMQKVFVETKFSFPAAKGSPTLTRY